MVHGLVFVWYSPFPNSHAQCIGPVTHFYVWIGGAGGSNHQPVLPLPVCSLPTYGFPPWCLLYVMNG